MNLFYKVNAGDVPLPTDVNQYADAFQGNADVTTLNFADTISAPSAAPTATVAAGSGLGVGTYQYAFTYVTGYKKSNGALVYGGETNLSPVASVTTTSGNQQVNLTNISQSSASYVIARRIYRTKVNPSTAPTLSASGSGNTLPAGTYYVKYTWTYAGGGESLPSPEASQTVAAGQALNVTVPTFPTGVNGANIYVSTSSGTETYQRNITTTSTSFTAPLATGSNPPSASTFYKVAEISDNVTTTYTDTTADTSLGFVAPAANSTGTGFTKLNIGAQGNMGSSNVKYSGGHLHVENNKGYVFNDALWASYLTGNAYWDGSNWNRYDTAYPASALVINRSQEPQFRSAGAGANPITWNTYNIFHEGNFTTRTHAYYYLNAAQTLTANSWNRVKFDTKVSNLDYLNEFDTTNWYFVAANTGIYAVTFSCRVTGLGTGGATVRIGTNQLNRAGMAADGTQVAVANGTGTINISGSFIHYMSAGTQLELRIWTDYTGASLATGQQNTWAVISRIA